MWCGQSRPRTATRLPKSTGVDRRLLEAGVQHSGRPRHAGVGGLCAAPQEGAGALDRRHRCAMDRSAPAMWSAAAELCARAWPARSDAPADALGAATHHHSQSRGAVGGRGRGRPGHSAPDGAATCELSDESDHVPYVFRHRPIPGPIARIAAVPQPARPSYRSTMVAKGGKVSTIEYGRPIHECSSVGNGSRPLPRLLPP